MDKVPMTKAGIQALEEELKNLKTVQRPAVIQAIAEAREHGDLSENAEYHAAREQQSFIEGRIKKLDGVLSAAEVIDTSQFAGQKTVKFGAHVVIVDEETDKEKRIQIVGEYEANADEGKISITSPIARALIGKSVDDSVCVKTPRGNVDYEIVDVFFR